jgi:hypothetical protein
VNIAGIVDAVVSHAQATALFDQVNFNEPRTAPPNGLTCAIWADAVTPIANASGLDITAVSVVLKARIYTSMFQQPYDAIDPAIMSAVDVLMTAYSADFQLNGLVMAVDLLGAYGTSLKAQAGYLNQDNKLYRIVDIFIPLILADQWPQAA